ncbi:Stationary phase survival protein SurE [Planctomycetales bacterium 10988]|nr:Stationary phase survival protein SurE [Planctomycetales bacterium 10988]
MKFLLTNDDGIDAPGILALEQAASQLGDCIIVAPDRPLSGCGHRVTTGEALHLQKHGPNKYSLSGTPADCARIGIHEVAGGVDWVLSGINKGGNLGWDVFPSGTVAAAREATFLGKQSLAISQYHKKGVPIDWDLAAKWTTSILQEVFENDLPSEQFWNVNLPHLPEEQALPERIYCELDTNALPIRFRVEEDKYHYDASYHLRERRHDRDVGICFSGKIALTKLSLR